MGDTDTHVRTHICMHARTRAHIRTHAHNSSHPDDPAFTERVVSFLTYRIKIL